MKEKYKTLLLILGVIIIFYGAIKYKKIADHNKKVDNLITIDKACLSDYLVIMKDTIESNDTIVRTVVWRLRADSHYVVKDFNKWKNRKREF